VQEAAMLQSEINVTPLVDVCLVLLIIFMIVLPSMVNGIEVQLPESRTGDAVESRVFPVTIKDDGTVYLDTLVVRREEAPAALQRLRATESTRPIAVRADKRVQYGEVAAVLAACREAGWTDVKLVSVQQRAASGVRER
jgi:biopolymer transport protein ExbD